MGFRQNKYNGLKMADLSPVRTNGEVNTDKLKEYRVTNMQTTRQELDLKI
ncbi:hypothetical protein [Macrococcus armenti]|nr:hypothetical protein [Macrococcus armenti]UBH17412.1 hypothetical protein LAU39_10000 [Macrococcus armenti]